MSMRLHTENDEAPVVDPATNNPDVFSAVVADATMTTPADDLPIQEMPELLPDEEIMGPLECAVLHVTCLNGIRFAFKPLGEGNALALAVKAGELLNRHLHSPEAVFQVEKNTAS